MYFRCGLTGEDLNRRWQDPHAKLHPVIYHSKGLISYIKQVLAKDIFLFCDFHGHSRKKNVFVYGCSLDQSWWPQDHEFYDDPSVYKVCSFQTGYTKLERFLNKNQHTQRKLLNFENWSNGEHQ